MSCQSAFSQLVSLSHFFCTRSASSSSPFFILSNRLSIYSIIIIININNISCISSCQLSVLDFSISRLYHFHINHSGQRHSFMLLTHRSNIRESTKTQTQTQTQTHVDSCYSCDNFQLRFEPDQTTDLPQKQPVHHLANGSCYGMGTL